MDYDYIKLKEICDLMLQKRVKKVKFSCLNGAYLRNGFLYCNGSLDRILEKLRNFDKVNSEKCETEFYIALEDMNI